jgi:ABC-2 type transport system permease protein
MIGYTTAMTRALALPEQIPIGRMLRAYATEARFEIVNGLRNVGASVPFIVIPVVSYLLFGVLMFSPQDAGPDAPDYSNLLFCGFASLGALMPGIFGGINLAMERESRLLELKRALPAPAGANLLAKFVTTMAFTAIAMTLVSVAALMAGAISLSLGQVLAVWVVMVIGSIPFCAMGFLIGALSSASAAPAYGNLLFLPMMWLSGIFIPLPAILQPYVVIWPAFHLNQVALALGGVDEFVYLPLSLAAGVLVGVTVLCGGLAVRRLARSG